MTSKYGSENVSLEYRDFQATTMSLDRTNQYALLAGRKYLAVISLVGPEPGDLLVRIPYGGKYEISNTQWSHLSNANLVAIASSQRCDIFELTDGTDLKCIHRLKCHTRVITDLDWCKQDANLLATSSFDSYVHIWDVRYPRQSASEKPQISLTALDGASQVRWNKWKEEEIASCDGGHVKIWDIRKTGNPVEYIAAHASKINGLEWVGKDVIITAAQDCTVKFNRLSAPNPVKAKGPILTLTAPVWRARPAPFGRGIVTQSVPILRRDSGLLSLWDWKRFSSPVFTVQAQDISEFAWKRIGGTCELLTWSRDQTLRIWSLPNEIVELCGEDKYQSLLNNTDDILDGEIPGLDFTFGSELEENGKSTEGSNSPEKSDSKTGKKEKQDKNIVAPTDISKRDENIKNEYESISNSKPENVFFEQLEFDKGIIRFSWKTDQESRSLVVVQANFPVTYPSAPPTFGIASGGNEIDKNHLLKLMKQRAQQCARKKEQCLFICISQFAEFMNFVEPLEDPDNFPAFPNRGVSNIPFPRTSGARFCSAGVLVCFGRPSYLKRVKSNCDAGTPRSLIALGPFLRQLAHEAEESPARRRAKRVETRAGLVTIFDVSSFIPVIKDIAEEYKYVAKPNKRREYCSENAGVVANHSPEVSRSWDVASVVAKYASMRIVTHHLFAQITSYNLGEVNDVDDEEMNWITHHPLGSKLIHSMVTHYASNGDVQTASTMVCLYTVPDQTSSHVHNHTHKQGVIQSQIPDNHGFLGFNVGKSQAKQPTGLGGSPYHTVHGSDTLHGVVVNPLSDNFFRQHRSNSWSESLDDLKGENGGMNVVQGKASSGFILDNSMNRLYDFYKKAYAEILYRWGFLQQRAEVLKCLTEGVEMSYLVRSGVDYYIECKFCGSNTHGPNCQKCKRIISFCSICHIPARGLSTFCISCGHGGHSQHVFEWFKKNKTCPTGCGCACLVENARNFR